MSDPLELRRMIGDIIIGVQDKDRLPYPGDYARAIETAINDGSLLVHRNRDNLWCEALMILDPRDVEAVLARFNSSRPDKE